MPALPGGQFSDIRDKMSLARDTGHRGSILGRSWPFRDGWQAYVSSAREPVCSVQSNSTQEPMSKEATHSVQSLIWKPHELSNISSIMI